MNTHKHRGKEVGFGSATIRSATTAPMNKMLQWRWKGEEGECASRRPAAHDADIKGEARESERMLVEQFTGVTI